jgi:ABC-type thiamine transport system ATPase subunit
MGDAGVGASVGGGEGQASRRPRQLRGGSRLRTRVAACLARLSALELVDGSRWWNRRQRRRMAAALEAYAEELESAADADRRHPSVGPCLTGPKTFLRSV